MSTKCLDALAGARVDAGRGARSAAYPLWYASDEQRQPAPRAPRPSVPRGGGAISGRLRRRSSSPYRSGCWYAFVVAPDIRLGSSASNAPRHFTDIRNAD